MKKRNVTGIRVVKKDWYDNKKLFEMIQELQDELTLTREAVKKYNGLRELIGDLAKTVKGVCEDVNTIKAEGTGKNKLASGIVMTIGIVGTLIGIAGGILAIASRLGR